MSDSRTNATPETTNAAPTAHPPVRENQRAVETKVAQDAIAGQRVMRSVGGGSPETPPEQFAGALAGMEGRSQAGMLRQLQRSYGNSYVGSVIQRKADGSGSCSECEKKEIQRKGEGDVSSVPDGFEAAMQRSGLGQPLDEGTRSFMESRFGNDFGNVQVHTDNAAAEAAEHISAQAFTTGRDIYFGRGRYQPQSTDGKKLVAHELTHVLQQTGEIQAKLIVGQSDDAYEREAESAAEKLIAETSIDQAENNINILKLNVPVVQRDDTQNNPPSSPPTPDPEAEKKALEERHQKAFDAVQARVGQAAAKVYFSYPKVKRSDDTEEFFIEEIVKRPPGEKKLLGFETQGAAVVYASLMGAGRGAVVLSQDNLFFAAKLKAGTKGLNARHEFLPSFDWKDVLIPGSYVGKVITSPTQGYVYRVENYAGVVSVISLEGLAFQLNMTEPPSSSSAQYLNKDQLSSTADAASMQEIANIPEIQKQIISTPEQQETFIRQYFHARGAEVLNANEAITEKLAEDFKPTTPSTGGNTGKGVSSNAQVLINSSRRLAADFRRLLKAQAQLQGQVDYYENRVSRGGEEVVERIKGVPIFLRQRRDDLRKALKETDTAIQQIQGASPMLALMIPTERSAPSKFNLIEKSLYWQGSNFVAAYEFLTNSKQRTVYGENPVDASLFGQAATPENDDKIRADFEKKLDAVRQAIRKARAEIVLGDTDDLLGMSGLQQQVKVDLSKDPSLSQKLTEILSNHAIKETAYTIAETVIMIGALFLPGGVFISSAIGFATAARDMDKNLRQWDIAKASAIDPATALIDQQEVESQLVLNSLMLALSAIDLGSEAVKGLEALETGGKLVGLESKVSKETLLAERNNIRQQAKNLDNIKPIKDENLLERGFDAEIQVEVQGEKHVYRHKSDGTWCRFSDEACGLSLGSEIEGATQSAKQKTRKLPDRYTIQDINDLKALLEKPPTKPTNLTPVQEKVWERYQKYYQERLNAYKNYLEGKTSKAIEPPRTWDSYLTDLEARVGGSEFQTQLTNETTLSLQGTFEVGSDVGVSRKAQPKVGKGELQKPDQLIVDLETKEVATVSNKSRPKFYEYKDDLDPILKKDIEGSIQSQVKTDVNELFKKYSGDINLRRELASLKKGDKLQVKEVILVYDQSFISGELPHKIIAWATKQARDIDPDIIFHITFQKF